MADTTNTLALSAVDDVHPTSSVIDGSNARPPYCPDGWSSSPSLVAPTLKTLPHLPDSLPPRSEMASRQPHSTVVALALRGAHHPRYAVARSKQKSSSRSPASININMPRTSLADIEMSDATNVINVTSVSLPRYLARSAFRPLPTEAISAAAPELADTPLNYIHDGLQCLGPE